MSALSTPHPLSNCFIEAAVQLGYPRNPDFNGESQLGAGFYPLNTKDGKRHSCAIAFLDPIRDRPNLTIATGTQATRLLFSGDRASGVAYQQNGATQEVTADREVILTAGVFDSPKLLMLSGIRPADQQQQADVDALVAGVKRTRELLQAAAFDPFRGEEIAPGAAVVSDDAIAVYIRQVSEAFWHSVGTCKMGNDALAVVDDHLRVRGVTGLRVADTSIQAVDSDREYPCTHGHDCGKSGRFHQK